MTLIEPEIFEINYRRHQDWLARGEGVARHRLYFYGDRDYSLVDLRGLILRRARFLGAQLAGLDLSGADLSQCFFDRVNFAGACLRGVDFRMSVVRFSGFTGADLRDVKAHGAALTEVDFRGSDLRDAQMWGCGIKNAKINRDTRVKGARLPRGKMTGLTDREMAQRGAKLK